MPIVPISSLILQCKPKMIDIFLITRQKIPYFTKLRMPNLKLQLPSFFLFCSVCSNCDMYANDSNYGLVTVTPNYRKRCGNAQCLIFRTGKTRLRFGHARLRKLKGKYIERNTSHNYWNERTWTNQCHTKTSKNECVKSRLLACLCPTLSQHTFFIYDHSCSSTYPVHSQNH